MKRPHLPVRTHNPHRTPDPNSVINPHRTYGSFVINRLIWAAALFLAAFLISRSCVTSERLSYLQEHEPVPEGQTLERVVPDYYKVKINDNLFVRVVTPDPKWSMMFNTLPTQQGITATEQTVDLISYRVLQDGNIMLPFVGAVEVAGLTIPEITRVLTEEYSGYIADADITVKLVNSYVSLLGSVRQPGRYPIYKEHMNIFEAIAMAGDLNDFSARRNIQVVRETGEETVVHEFDLTDKEIIHSEFYYVLPNDVIYAPPMKGRFFRMEAFPYALVFSSITTFILVFNFVNNATTGN